jgi:hypothetical protein
MIDDWYDDDGDHDHDGDGYDLTKAFGLSAIWLLDGKYPVLLWMAWVALCLLYNTMY